MRPVECQVGCEVMFAVSLSLCGLQVGGRGLVLFGLLAAEPKLQDKEPVMWLFLIWSMIEMIRS